MENRKPRGALGALYTCAGLIMVGSQQASNHESTTAYFWDLPRPSVEVASRDLPARRLFFFFFIHCFFLCRARLLVRAFLRKWLARAAQLASSFR